MSEHDTQAAFFAWAARQRIPGIELLHAVPNGGEQAARSLHSVLVPWVEMMLALGYRLVVEVRLLRDAIAGCIWPTKVSLLSPAWPLAQEDA
jgi:hypothetical protein